MFSSNSFNVCPHCGKANPLNARYCSSCGKQLMMPQEVVVCHKCHKPNPPMASFCGACGTPLRAGEKRRCPKCNREMDNNSNVCSCGFDFTAVHHTDPAVIGNAEQPAAQASSEQSAAKKKKNAAEAVKPKYNSKGGRLVAAVALIVVLLISFLTLAPYYKYDAEGSVIMNEDGSPATLNFAFLNFAKGILFSGMGENGVPMYGYDLVQVVMTAFKQAETLAEREMTPLQFLQEIMGIGGLAIIAMVALWAIVAVIQALVYLIRLFIGKRAKHFDYLSLILAGLTTIWTLLAFFIGMFAGSPEGTLSQIYNIFVPSGYYSIGYMVFLIPLGFWFMFIMSIVGRAKELKEDVA